MSVPPWKYSTRRNNKKRENHTRFVMVCCIEVTPWDAVSRQWRIDIGMGHNQEGGIFLQIGCKLSAQPKTDEYHGVISGIIGNHCCKYFPHGA